MSTHPSTDSRLRSAVRMLRHRQPAQAVKLLTKIYADFVSDPTSFPDYGVIFCDALISLPQNVQPQAFADAAQGCFPAKPDEDEPPLFSAVQLLFAELLPYARTNDRILRLLSATGFAGTPEAAAQKLLSAADSDASAQDWFGALHFSRAAQILFEQVQSPAAAECAWRVAVLLLQLGQPEEAAKLDEIHHWTAEPASLPDALRGGHVLLEMNRLTAAQAKSEALTCATQALTQLPASPIRGRLLMQRAEIYEQTNEYTLAAADCQVAAQLLNGESGCTCLQQAMADLRDAKEFEASIRCSQTLRERIMREHFSAEHQALLLAHAWVAEGLCEYALDHSAEELTCYQHAREWCAATDLSLLHRINCYCADTEYRTGNPSGGAASYAEALTQIKNDRLKTAQTECEWGDHLRDCTAQFSEAVSHYSAGIRIYRKLLRDESAILPLAMAYNSRGICAFHLKEYKKQLQNATQAIRLLRQLDETPEVLMRLSACLRNRGDSLDRLARCAHALDDYRHATELFRLAAEQDSSVDTDGELSELILNCGRVCDRMKQFDSSNGYYSDLLNLLENHPVESEARAEMTALAHLRRGDARIHCSARIFTDALSDYNAVLHDLPEKNSVPALQNLRILALRRRGELYAFMGQYPLALRDFNDADSDEHNQQAASASILKGESHA